VTTVFALSASDAFCSSTGFHYGNAAASQPLQLPSKVFHCDGSSVNLCASDSFLLLIAKLQQPSSKLMQREFFSAVFLVFPFN
jgi:hypothetical protein